MRLSATDDLRASHREAKALLDTLGRVDRLRLAYDPGLVERLVPWIERARDVAASNASAHELQSVRRGIDEAVCEIAALTADQLTLEHGPEIDLLMRHWQLVSAVPSGVAAVIVDPTSPDIPGELCARVWPVSLELVGSLSDSIAQLAPDTADWLVEPGEPDEHKVVAFTFGRVMRTTRKIPRYADA